jgi:putative transposase
MNARKSLRLRGFDYSQRGVYYVSICTHLGLPLLGHTVGNRIVLGALGHLVDRLWRDLPRHAAGLRLDAFLVLPSHVHGILVLTQPPVSPQREAFGQPTRNSLPTIVRGFKAAVTREWRRQSGVENSPVWQSRYVERVVRSRQELTSMRCFVRDNLLWHRLSDRDPW